jgi:hypothetical protein
MIGRREFITLLGGAVAASAYVRSDSSVVRSERARTKSRAKIKANGGV